MGILALVIYFGSADLEIIFSMLNIEEGTPTFLLPVTFAILIGIMSKSAQFGLHVWLPDAMEGRVGPAGY